MRTTGIVIVLLLTTACSSIPKPSWKVTENVQAPESVYFDSSSRLIFVANIVGSGTEKDGKGWISKLTSSGEMIESQWVSGLNAPKGMRSHNGILWVSDIDTLVGINIKKGKVIRRIRNKSAKFLNDVAITPEGNIFVSDTMGRVIYKLSRNRLVPFTQGDETDAPNGLLVRNGKLVVAAWGLGPSDWSTKVPGRLYSIDLKTKKKTLITDMPVGNLDGLELRNNGNYIVSDWMKGLVFEIGSDGSVSTLFNFGKKGVADIGYIPETDTVAVPQMEGNHVSAYQLK